MRSRRDGASELRGRDDGRPQHRNRWESPAPARPALRPVPVPSELDGVGDGGMGSGNFSRRRRNGWHHAEDGPDFLRPPAVGTRQAELGSDPAYSEAKIKQHPRDGLFVKPELKQARSSLNGHSKSASDHLATGRFKREASPFDHISVFKKVRASLNLGESLSTTNARRHRRGSVFEKIHFDPSIPLSSKKYENDGYFGYNMKSFTENSKVNIAGSSGVVLHDHGNDSKKDVFSYLGYK